MCEPPKGNQADIFTRDEEKKRDGLKTEMRRLISLALSNV